MYEDIFRTSPEERNNFKTVQKNFKITKNCRDYILSLNCQDYVEVEIPFL